MQKKCSMKLKQINLPVYANNLPHRKVSLENPSNMYLDFLIKPKLDNWNIINYN